MSYKVKTTSRFDIEFKKLDHYTKSILKGWIEKNLVNCENLREKEKAFNGNHSGKFRYRIGDYRLICHIEDDEFIILALSVGRRKNIYKK